MAAASITELTCAVLFPSWPYHAQCIGTSSRNPIKCVYNHNDQEENFAFSTYGGQRNILKLNDEFRGRP